MAIDTRHKRFSMMGMDSAGLGIHVLWEADAGGVEADDRQHLLDCYSGIAFGSPALGDAGDRFSMMNAVARSIHFMPMMKPDGTLDEGDRLHMIDLYSRIGADPPVVGGEEFYGPNLIQIPSYGIKMITGRFS